MIKQIFPVFAVLFSIVATAGYTQDFGLSHDSVAAPNSYRTPTINPAALSYGSGQGVGYTRGFDTDGPTEDFDFFLNFKNLAYQYQDNSGTGEHNFTLSFSLLDNVYFGTTLGTYTWQANTSNYTLGGLFRPTDYFSFGARSFFPSSGTSSHRIGFGLRPLVFTKLPSHVLTITTDFPILEGDLRSPVIALQSEVAEGIELSFGYDTENEGIALEASLALFNLKTGAASEGGTDSDVSRGRAYIHLSPKPFNRPKMPGRDLIYDYSQRSPIVETQSAMEFGNFYILSGEESIYDMSKRIKSLAEDPLVSGIIFINEHPASNYAHVIEMKNALRDFKATGKRVIFFSETMSSQDYVLAASTADRIYLSPSGMIDLKGVSISSPYLASFLEKWGVEVQNFRSSLYKSGYDFLSESEMREAEREALTSVVEDLYGTLTEMIEAGRGNTLNASVKEIVDAGPYLQAGKAADLGLVDKLIYEDQLEETIPFFERTVIRDNIPAQTVRKDWSSPRAGKIAVINAVGSIRTGEAIPGQGIGAQTLSNSIRKAREDNSIRAILLRVDSGGGSVVASDSIAREVKLCTEGEDAKPIVVSMGSTAASGGYYIAAYADRIVAYPTTITGSIGVLAPFPNIESLLEKQLIRWDVVKSGDSADFGSIYRPLTEEEQEKMRAYIDSAYRQFISTVAEGREMEKERVDKNARGRIWTGKQAEERGLVDSLGGISEAIAALRELADLPDEIELIDYSFADTWGTFLINTLSGDTLSRLKGGTENIALESLPPELRNFAEYLRRAEPIEKRGPLYVMPYLF